MSGRQRIVVAAGSPRNPREQSSAARPTSLHAFVGDPTIPQGPGKMTDAEPHPTTGQATPAAPPRNHRRRADWLPRARELRPLGLVELDPERLNAEQAGCAVAGLAGMLMARANASATASSATSRWPGCTPRSLAKGQVRPPCRFQCSPAPQRTSCQTSDHLRSASHVSWARL
jgi:hypothetical protein